MESVLFDPGYSDCVLGFSDNIEFVYSVFEEQIMPVKQKKFHFSILFPKIKSMVAGSIGFYLGCILWAVYIKSKKDAVIENNPCLDEKYDEDDSFKEIDYLSDFIQNKLVKDSRFFLNKAYTAPSEYINVLNTYKEFLSLNEGFIHTKTTNDIVLPKNIKSMNKNELTKIKEKIDEAIQKKDLSKLFDVYSSVFG